VAKGPIIGVLRILAPPLVTEESVRTLLVVVGTLARIAGVHGTKAEGGLELSGLPDPLLRGHKAQWRPAEGEGGQVLLANERLALGGESVEVRKGGGPNQPIRLRAGGTHQVESIQRTS